ncbi:sulfur oxidation c-type cytochrome SoxX [Marinibactrum halimedae]|uniref:Cytochrome c domain-containing protein n=1 Tax=Marinibactrum halimedae TaxID=1444977 RepID=A0AA37WQI3_9GAMM|nr:sulfur oxidation c-type cytochrome SoxX [Marinibactrum halimedae]MCD9460971.1 sulfur oxidation c-type cytochrome SoxX [Marinibactrum halimedae]GLS28086.1 hypothetical protein GCM10007877_38050 [Marinibactrum halimedae]
MSIVYTPTESTLFSEPALTSQPGDPKRGKQWIKAPEKGNCLLCHRFNTFHDAFQGNIGPDLSNVSNRLTTEEIRYRVIDPKRINPNSIMPAYFQTKGLQNVDPIYQGKTILSAQEIEDIIAYLSQAQ